MKTIRACWDVTLYQVFDSEMHVVTSSMGEEVFPTEELAMRGYRMRVWHRDVKYWKENPSPFDMAA